MCVLMCACECVVIVVIDDVSVSEGSSSSSVYLCRDVNYILNMMCNCVYCKCKSMLGCFRSQLQMLQHHATMKNFFFPCYSQTAETQTIKATSTGCTNRNRKREDTNMEVLRGVGVRGRIQNNRKKDMHTERGR